MAKVVRSLYAYDGDMVSRESALECKDKSLTVQDQAAEADINVLVERFGLTGNIPQKVRMPTYGDFIGVQNYQEALNAVAAAEAAFMELPAKVRARFENDAGAFVDFCSNPSNAEEALKLGLVVKEKLDGLSKDSGGPSGEAAAPAGSA